MSLAFTPKFHCLVATCCILALGMNRPASALQGGTQALKLDLRDHRQHRLTVLVQRRLHGTLLDHLAAEAEERWGRCDSVLVIASQQQHGF